MRRNARKPKLLEVTPILTHHDTTGAAAIAAVMLLTILWRVRQIDRRIAAQQAGGLSRSHLWLNFALLLLSAAFLAATIRQGVLQDYHLYRAMWAAVREGRDPWWMVDGVFGHYPINAYGPLFNALAILDRINPLLPKLCFAWTYLLFAVGTIKAAVSEAEWNSVATAAGLAWLWNPYVWVELAHYGHFDVLVGLFCVGAVAARIDRRDARSGACLALGVLLKYMPVVLLPFLILDRGRFRLRLLGLATALIGLGLGLSVLVWGTAVFRPIIFAVGRTSQYLSIYRYLDGFYSPISRLALGPLHQLGRAGTPGDSPACLELEPSPRLRACVRGRAGHPDDAALLSGRVPAVSDGAVRRRDLRDPPHVGIPEPSSSLDDQPRMLLCLDCGIHHDRMHLGG